MNMIKMILTGAFLVGSTFAHGRETDSVYRLVVALRDGSRIVGTAKFTAVPLKTAYADVKLPLGQIRSIVVGEQAREVTVTVANGDKLTGIPGRDAFGLSTSFGDVDVKLLHVTTITVAVLAAGAVDAGLVLYFPFDGDADDYSGNGQNGTVVGAVLAPDRSGKANSAYLFDGVNDYIWLPNTNVKSLQAHSITMWVLRNGAGVNHPRFFLNGTINECITFNQIGGGPGLHYRFPPPYAEPYMITSAGLSNDAWTFIAATYDGSKLRLYSNGDELVSLSLSCTIPTAGGTKAYIGGDTTPSSFDGCIDDVRVYNRTLSETEIKNLYRVQ